MVILHISLATLFIIQIVALCFVEYRKLIAEFIELFFEGRTYDKCSQKIKIYKSWILEFFAIFVHTNKYLYLYDEELFS